jgi:phosphoglycolate phosphatase-like HAD superfamily hydrolase
VSAAPGGTEDGRPLAVFDVDGVLADVAHRLHHLEARPKDWGAFFAAAGDDPPLATGVDLAITLSADHDLGYLTGRPEWLRRVTAAWLQQHGLPAGPLWMRPRGDHRPARVMKLDALRRLRPGPEAVEVVVDDDEEVVSALRDAGYAVLHATWAADSRGSGVLRRAQEEQGRT